MCGMYSDFPVVAEPEFFVMRDLHSRKWVHAENYGEMIWTSNNEFLLDDYHNRSLLKSYHFPELLQKISNTVGGILYVSTLS